KIVRDDCRSLYSVVLAIAIASSSVWNVVITAIGPKRSSSNAAIPGYAGELRRLEEESWARSAGQNLRTLGDCFGDDPLDIGGLPLVDDRADLTSLTQTVAHDEILGLSYEGFDIRVSNAFVYDVSAAGEADLYRWKKAAHAAALASASTSTPSSTM